MKFEIIHQSKKSRARVCKIHTPHGVIDTPSFVAVGTNATLKALDSQTVDEIGLQLLFCNTYHLLLQPGPEVIASAGGIHKFMNRSFPIITDSGGFQVFSLAYGSVASELKSKGTKKHGGSVLKVSEEGVLFRSYRDGKKILLTPESSIDAQKQIGADIIIPLDELPPYHISVEALHNSLERTHRWEKRSLEQHLKNPCNQAIYAVIHGGVDPELRKKSCETLRALPFDGFAIGGSVGKDQKEMLQMLQEIAIHLPADRPSHLLGIGDLSSILASIPLGIDTFDSSYPTKIARHGMALYARGALNLTKSENARDFTPIDPCCTCWTCRHYTKAYLHHLFKAKELTALSLVTLHNLHFMVRLLEQVREQILQDAL